MTYRGKEVKRVVEPNENEWVTIEPHSSIEHETRIGGRYQLDADGEYNISMQVLCTLNATQLTILLFQMSTHKQLDVRQAFTTVTLLFSLECLQIYKVTGR